MIRLSLPSRPEFLTDELVQELTAKFKADKTQRVWNRPDLKEALMQISYNKCAYSEVKLGEEGKYMQIEHFFPKSKYPDKVLEWGNLLPCLNLCNANKRDLDPNKVHIVNPYLDDPKDYFYLENGRLVAQQGKQKAINTIMAYDLNNSKQLRESRFLLLTHIRERLEDIYKLYPNEENHALARLNQLLSSCGRTSEYSAVKSTAIIEDSHYKQLRQLLIESGKWNQDWQALENELIFCSLPKNSNN